jgi:hypothetical protein
MRTLILVGLLALGGNLGLPAQVQAGCHGCCNSCGCQNVKTVCRLVCEMKDQVDFVYEKECEDYCLMGKSDKCGTKCVPDCHKWCGFHKEIIWKPHCSCKVRTRCFLIKIPVVKQVPTYRCVVEHICNGCGAGCCTAQAASPEETQAAIAAAEAKGILPVSANEEVVVSVEEPASDDSSTAVAPKAADDSALLYRLFKRN